MESDLTILRVETASPADSPGGGRRCEDGCQDCVGPTLCSKTHEVSLSDLNCETVLEFLEKKNWQICPYCLAVEKENLPFHFIIGHPEIYDIAEKLTPVEKNEDSSIHGDRIKHKFLNCEKAGENQRELFSKIKLTEVRPGIDKKDRIRCAMFLKRQAEDSSLIEKLLQQSRGKKIPGLTRKSRRFSGNILPPQKRTKEENLEKMIQDLYCAQCHRTFKDQAQARDEKENKHHFCFIVGNLKTSIKIDPSPSPTKKAKLCCSFCPQLKNIVFSEPRELMKHLVLAHKTKFFINEIQKQNEKKDLAKDDLKCYHSKCKVISASQEDHLLHIGVDHEKLFFALKHDKKNNLKNIAKELFPKKYQEHTHDWGRGSGGSSQKGAKRNLEVGGEVEGEAASPSKKAKSEGQKSVVQSSVNNMKTASTSQQARSTEPVPTQDAPSTASSSSEAKPRKMRRETCVVCGDKQTFSNKTILYNHLAGEHFFQKIREKYPGTDSDSETSFPCSYPGCSEVFPSELARVRHLGRLHGLVEQCLAALKGDKTSGEKEEKKHKQTSSRGLKCRKCSEEFATRAMMQLHDCHSLLAKPPAGDRRSSVDYVEDVYSTSRVEKDLREEFSDASVDSSELNEAVGDLSQRTEDREEEREEGRMEEDNIDTELEADPWRGQTCEIPGGCVRKDCRVCEYCQRRYHKREHGHFPCDVTNCNLCFPTETLQMNHIKKDHDFEDL